MEYTVEQTFYKLKYTCLGWAYKNYDDALRGLIYAMRDKIGHPFIGEQYHNLRFVMNLPLYHEFYIACQMSCKDSDMYRGIPISPDPSLYEGDTRSPNGIVRLIYEEPDYNHHFSFELTERNRRKIMPPEGASGFSIKECFFAIPTNLKIKKVIINDPATIVMWNDGTKTVVKCQEGDTFDPEKGLAMCVVKKMYGLKDFYKSLNPAFNNWIGNLDVEENIWDRIRKITS